MDACFIPPAICAVIGINRFFVDLIRQRSVLLLAGIANLIVFIILHFRIWFAYY